MEINRKSDPASPWPIPRSFSTVGNKGARMILAIKLRKKIKANNKRGLDCARMDLDFSSWTEPGSLP
jgi:hypothetical protein